MKREPHNLAQVALWLALKGKSHRFVEEAMLRAFVLFARTVVESVAEAPVIDTAESAPSVRTGAREPLSLIGRARTFCNRSRTNSLGIGRTCN